MVKLITLSALLIANSYIFGQASSTATATTTAEIISPVGAEISGELIINNFYPGNRIERLEIKNNKITLKNSHTILESASDVMNPSFHIFNGKSSYTITIEYDPLLKHSNAFNEPIYIEELSILPLSTPSALKKTEDGFSVGAVLRLNPSQAPGHYSSPAGYTVVIHFN